jgi:Protein of unknown function (DUF1573)
MKKLVLLVAFALLGSTATFAQEATSVVKKEVKKAKKSKKVKKSEVAEEVKAYVPQIQGAGMVFDTETVDYGTIAQNSNPNREFVFTNNGDKPLLITNTQGSCGCTVPVTPKDPIAPGAKGVIGVKYATDRVGAFTKTITVTSNAEGMPAKVITIKGVVLAAETAPAAPAPVAPKS